MDASQGRLFAAIIGTSRLDDMANTSADAATAANPTDTEARDAWADDAARSPASATTQDTIAASAGANLRGASDRIARNAAACGSPNARSVGAAAKRTAATRSGEGGDVAGLSRRSAAQSSRGAVLPEGAKGGRDCELRGRDAGGNGPIPPTDATARQQQAINLSSHIS
jgi:hypothetical protein